MHARARDYLAPGKIPLANGGHPASDIAIYIGDSAGHVEVDDSSDIDVRDVDVVIVNGAYGVTRDKYLVGAKWKPTDPNTASDYKSRASDKPNERWRVYGNRYISPWRPAPGSADVSPSAVVKWSESPGRAIDPCPTPGTCPAPVSVAVRCPPCIDSCWHPIGAVGTVIVPRTIAGKVFISGHLGGHVMLLGQLRLVL